MFVECIPATLHIDFYIKWIKSADNEMAQDVRYVS